MAYDDDYRELIENARDALCALLDESEHDSWPTLRDAYGVLRAALEKDDAKRGAEARHRATLAALDRTAAPWMDMPRAARESVVFNLLGDRGRSIGELTKRINVDVCGADSGESAGLIEGSVRGVVTSMFKAGQLEREPEPEPVRGKTVRYRYFRKRTLDGPITDLERAFHDDGEEA
jgi:hypothetical protein